MKKAQAGWYADGHGLERWYDGEGWTTTVRARLPRQENRRTERAAVAAVPFAVAGSLLAACLLVLFLLGMHDAVPLVTEIVQF